MYLLVFKLPIGVRKQLEGLIRRFPGKAPGQEKVG